MSTSFVVVPPVKFRQPDQLTRLNHLFANKVGVTVWDIWKATSCSLEDATGLIHFLIRQGYGWHMGSQVALFLRLPLTFVASLEGKPFAAGGRR